ncbi:MAG TPA: YlxR family protein [Bacillota bacterium]|nr:YlxR family protein [Bacillota bacterium]HQB80680.1 YlxR family protein [Bacillota bacterium]
MKKKPLRMCVGCRESFLQEELLRLVASEDGVRIDRGQKLPGRGAYLCCRTACVEKAKKRQSLQRALKCPVPEAIWVEIDQAIKVARVEE